MNQNSKELHEDLEKLANKYNIEQCILLFKEFKKPDSDTVPHRVILFKPAPEPITASDFGLFFIECLNISKSLQKIMDYVSEYFYQEALKIDYIRNKLANKEKDKKIN